MENFKKLSDDDLVKATHPYIMGPDGPQMNPDSQTALAELLRRLNQSTTKYSKILIFLTIVLMLLAGIQIWLMAIQICSIVKK